jgi:hypothetical protein
VYTLTGGFSRKLKGGFLHTEPVKGISFGAASSYVNLSSG